MHGRKKIIIYILISIIGLFWLSGCDSPSSDSGNTESKAEAEAQNGLIYKSSMKLLYAKNFSVDYYEGGYKILTTKDGTQILTVPKGRKTPKDIDKDIIVLKEPVSDLYLVASGVMDMFDKLDAVDTIKFSGLDSDGWYIDSARKAIESGSDSTFHITHNTINVELPKNQTADTSSRNFYPSGKLRTVDYTIKEAQELEDVVKRNIMDLIDKA